MIARDIRKGLLALAAAILTAAASPAVVERKAVTEQSELPKDTPVETTDPDRIVTMNDPLKPKEETTVAAVQTVPSEESVAAEATAAPSQGAKPEAERSIAPAQGSVQLCH